jgi:transposase
MPKTITQKEVLFEDFSSFIPPGVEAELTPVTRAFVYSLLEKIGAVQSKLAEKSIPKTPTNSSLPPSSGHPHGKPPKSKPKSGRRRGGQPGHKRHTRPLVPTDQCDAVEKYAPTTCRCCSSPLSGVDPSPWRHQVSELPEIKPIITEYQLSRLHCRKCNVTTRAKLPEGIPRGAFGPRLTAFTGLLLAHFRQSKRKASLFLSDLLNIPCCPSMVVKMQETVSDALSTPHDDLRVALNSEAIVHMDETPTKETNCKAWMWVATTNQIAVFAIFATRAATAITHLLGENFQGIVNCDRAKMYFSLKHVQWCWSHLIRDIQAMIDSGVPDRVYIGKQLDSQAKSMFRNWHRYKTGELIWENFQIETVSIAKRFNELLYQGGGSHDRKLRNQCLSLHAHHENLWRFLCNQGVEPTNNAAERALRGPVIYRKLSFGTQSETGSRFVERMFSIIETTRLQNRNTFQYLIKAVTAKLRGETPPNILGP